MFKWKDAYKTNIEEIDKQHQKIFEIGNKLYDTVKAGDHVDQYDEIMNIIEELRNYTRYHFDYEEEMLEKHGYENLETQKKQHEIYIKKIEGLKEEEVDEDQKGTKMGLLTMVSDWIALHILNEDFRYREFITDQMNK